MFCVKLRIIILYIGETIWTIILWVTEYFGMNTCNITPLIANDSFIRVKCAECLEHLNKFGDYVSSFRLCEMWENFFGRLCCCLSFLNRTKLHCCPFLSCVSVSIYLKAHELRSPAGQNAILILTIISSHSEHLIQPACVISFVASVGQEWSVKAGMSEVSLIISFHHCFL